LFGYCLAYAEKMICYIVIFEPQNGYPCPFKRLRSDVIVFFCVTMLVLMSVQFYYQLGGRAVEVRDVVIDHLLPLKRHWVKMQVVIPQLAFLLCYIPTA